MADLPSILGGMAQGFVDFGKGAVDMFGTGGAAIGDLIEGARTGKVTTKNQDDFRKWLYQTDSTKDAAAKGLGTALNGVQTVLDYIPGVNVLTRNPLGNAAQGALGGLADEFKTYGENYDLGRAGQRAAVSGAAAAASGSLADALKGSSNALLSSNTLQGLARGATSGAISAGGYAAIDGGDVLEAAKQGAGMGALIGGVTGAFQDFKPAKTYDMGLTDAERASRLKEVRKMRNAIGPEKALYDGTLDDASAARWSELWNLEQAYKNGFDNYEDYHNTLRPTKGLDDETLGLVLKNMEEPELQPWMQKGSHQPTFDPTMSSLASSMDRTVSGDSFMPDDFYQHMDWYGGGDTKPYLESASAIQKIRGNPNAKVTMYRATVGDKIYPNDWVTLSPEYAKQHLANALRDQPDAKIIKQTVAARDLRWPGDDINEFGYYPITNGDIARVKALETTLSDADMAVNNPRYLTDENGNPRTFYHGSPNKNITEFDINQAGKNTSSGEHALYFTDSPEVADEFSYERLPSDSMFVDNRGAKGRVYPVNLAMDNPLDLSNLSDKQIEELWQYASPLGKLDGKEKFIKNMKAFRDYGNDQLIKTNLDLDKLANSQYDGFTARMYPNQDNQAREYAVFDNSKVKMLEDVLANDDMTVNAAKVAPGQLGLFDDMPTQTPKTGTRQTSLFDQPDNPYLDYYSSDIDTTPLTPEAPANPYAPVDGQVTQAMRDRAADILGNWKKNGVPENELYNAINPDTLPLGYKEAINVLDNIDAKKYLKDNLGVTDIKKAKFDKVLDYLFGDNEDAKRTYSELRDQQIQSAKEKAKLLGLPEPSKSFVPSVEGKLREEVSYKMAKDIRKSLRDIPVDAETGEVMPLTQANLNRLDPKVHSFRTGYTAAADEAFSERLGIAPGNTPKYNGRIDVRGAYGRYSHPMYGVGGDVAIFERKIDNPEDAISSVAHERLHSFQNEATNSANNAGRYSKEVENAFKDLRKDLEQHYKSWDETAKRYGGGRGNTYWNSQKEQEARMLETYLQNKGYTDAPGLKNKYRAGEWGNEINPAFDKFFDKLRDLSKRGVALPALAALFGGGAYMASQENDKEKEVK